MDDTRRRNLIKLLSWGAGTLMLVCLLNAFFAYKDHNPGRLVAFLIAGVIFAVLEQIAVSKQKALTR
jgi:hypothetical protein